MTHCLTCFNEISLPPCGHNSVKMSKDLSKFILYCKGPTVPYTAVFHVAIPSKLISVLDRNEHILDYLKSKELPHIEHISFTTDNNSELLHQIVQPIKVNLIVPKRILQKEGEKAGLIIILKIKENENSISNRSDI